MVAPPHPLVLETHHPHGVVQLTLNRPRALNALNSSLYDATTSALQHHTSRHATKIILLTGAGTRTFCAGMDIKEASDATRGSRTISAARGFMHALLRCHKPVVAAVFGAVTGIGVTMLLHCDAVYAARNATFETPFAEIGIVPEFGSSWMFPRFLGLHLAGRLLLRGEVVDAGEMAKVGAMHAAPTEDCALVVQQAVEEAVKWSATVEGERWEAVLEAKQLLREPIRKQVEKVMKEEFLAIDKQIKSGTLTRLLTRKVEALDNRRGKL